MGIFRVFVKAERAKTGRRWDIKSGSYFVPRSREGMYKRSREFKW